jgi:predicted unusual protein kinase regulating ubiquinone biosynthesis (AarF/ABC1/UbiB family)
MSEQNVLNAAMIEQILALLPAEQQAKLIALVDETVSLEDEQVQKALREALASLDWEGQRQQIWALIGQIMPLETLVPAIYAEWRPIVRDAVAFFASQLSTERLVPKLIEQMMLPAEMPLEQRVIILISQMPSLQKLGQVVARNQNLDPAFRTQLTRLENSIQDITLAQVRAEIERQLARQIKAYRVQMQELILAEASVSAVVRFTWYNPKSGKQERGVFKVLKPYVAQYLGEEMKLLQGLAYFFEKRREHYRLPPVGLPDVIDEVSRLLQQEINFPKEQEALIDAAKRYADIPGVSVPHLIPELCAPFIMAMSFHAGVKVTDAFRNNPRKRTTLAERIIKALIAVPLFAQEEYAFFHADLHAGNLIVDEQTGDLVILDWAQVAQLRRYQRRQIVLLTLAIAWRDAERTYDAIRKLSIDNFALDESKAALLRGHITEFFATLSPFTVPELAQVLSLLDQIVLSGITFPPELLMFRKTLFTLLGVLHDIAPNVKIDRVMGDYILKLMSQEAPQRFLRLPIDSSTTFRSHLSNHDLTMLTLTLPLLGQRLWLQTIEQVTNKSLNNLPCTSQPPLPAALLSFFEKTRQTGANGLLEQLKGLKWPCPTIRFVNKQPNE